MASNLKLFYISNCIKRIMDAECETRLLNRRVEDVALAVELAASDGLKVAHKYLIKLCDDAEAGKYAAQHTLAPDGLPVPPKVSVSKKGERLNKKYVRSAAGKA